MKRKLLSLILTLVIGLSVFAGCDLVRPNEEKYYSAIVATIPYADGTKDEITKQELITAFNSYGYNYVQSYGQDFETAVKSTLDTIIDRKITIKAVEDYYAKLEDGNPDKNIVLNANEKTYLYDQTLNALYSNLKTYFFEVIDEKEAENKTDEASVNSSVFVDYEREVEIVDGVILKKKPADTIRGTYEAREGVDFETAATKEQMYQDVLKLASDSSNDLRDKQLKNALSKYYKAIKNGYSYKKFSSDKTAMMFEIERIYDIVEQNYLVEKYEVIFNKSKNQDNRQTNVSMSDVLKLYEEKVKTDYKKYTAAGGKATFESDILNSFSSVDYILETKDLENDVASNYFQVAYIKLNFDEILKAEQTRIEDKKKAGGYARESDYQDDIEALYSKVYTKVRSATTGEETDEKVYVYDKDGEKGLLTKIKEALEPYQYQGDDGDYQIAIDKAAAFRDYLYRYNDDDSLKGAQTNAVFGISNSGEVLANSTFSSNEDVKNAIKALYNNGEAKIGDLSEIVRASDGVYIFFYAGDIKNQFIVGKNFKVTETGANIKILTSTRINIFSSKTIFDVLYETLATDNFSVFQNMNMNVLKNNLVSGKIEVIENNLKTL